MGSLEGPVLEFTCNYYIKMRFEGRQCFFFTQNKRIKFVNVRKSISINFRTSHNEYEDI